jgi:predicted NUDIX family NTP pyrophosphohydrolase
VPATSAGILLYRRSARGLEVLLAHPGGPLWAKRDAGAWTLPKGLVEEGEHLEAAARREFREEMGFEAEGEGLALTPLRQPSRKVVHAWAVEGECDASQCRSIEFTMEWPPKSGKHASFPEVDRAEWFTLDEARRRILRGQAPFLDELEAKLSGQSA